MRREGIWMMVGSVMLVLITMIAAVLLYLWFTGYQSRVQTGAASINLLPAASITEATLMINNHTSVTLSVENVGDTSIYITEASILTINGETICTATPSGDGNGEASPSKLNETVVGNILIASFTCSQPLSDGTYTVQAVTNSGLTLQSTIMDQLSPS
ncbi:hypothetical protein [Thermocladium modestius]|nr:hypothetical protein [Thermocladium modestius]